MRHRFVQILLLSILVVAWGCTTGDSDNAIEIAKQYVQIPEDANNIMSHFVGEGQARNLYVKFQLPSSTVEEFVGTVCVENQELESDYQFVLSPQLYKQPNWFSPEWARSRGGECIESNIVYHLVVEENGIESVVYLWLAFI